MSLECLKTTCLNYGECIKKNINDLPTCKCKYDTFGDRCQYCKECENNSTCQIILDNYTKVRKKLVKNTIKKRVTFETLFLQVPIQKNCQCKSYRYNGQYCENDLCFNYCKNNGTCEEQASYDPITASTPPIQCKCSNTRYVGQQCEVDMCESLKAHSCVGTNCILYYNQTVKECQCFCSNLCNRVYCNSRGKCEQSKCSCYNGYYGERCEHKISKSIDIDTYDDTNSNSIADEENKSKLSTSKILFIILLTIAVVLVLLFVVLSFIFRKKFILKRQYASRQFQDEEDEFNLSMDDIQIRNPTYRSLKDADDEDEDDDVNGQNETNMTHAASSKLKKEVEENKQLISNIGTDIGFDNNAAIYSDESNYDTSTFKSSKKQQISAEKLNELKVLTKSTNNDSLSNNNGKCSKNNGSTISPNGTAKSKPIYAKKPKPKVIQKSNGNNGNINI